MITNIKEKLKNYVELKKGEIIKEGDLYLDPYQMELYKTKCIGENVGTRGKCTNRYFRSKGKI